MDLQVVLYNPLKMLWMLGFCHQCLHHSCHPRFCQRPRSCILQLKCMQPSTGWARSSVVISRSVEIWNLLHSTCVFHLHWDWSALFPADGIYNWSPHDSWKCCKPGINAQHGSQETPLLQHHSTMLPVSSMWIPVVVKPCTVLSSVCTGWLYKMQSKQGINFKLCHPLAHGNHKVVPCKEDFKLTAALLLLNCDFIRVWRASEQEDFLMAFVMGSAGVGVILSSLFLPTTNCASSSLHSNSVPTPLIWLHWRGWDQLHWSKCPLPSEVQSPCFIDLSLNSKSHPQLPLHLYPPPPQNPALPLVHLATLSTETPFTVAASWARSQVSGWIYANVTC